MAIDAMMGHLRSSGIIAWYATLYGLMLVMLGFRLRGILHTVVPQPA